MHGVVCHWEVQNGGVAAGCCLKFHQLHGSCRVWISFPPRLSVFSAPGTSVMHQSGDVGKFLAPSRVALYYT